MHVRKQRHTFLAVRKGSVKGRTQTLTYRTPPTFNDTMSFRSTTSAMVSWQNRNRFQLVLRTINRASRLLASRQRKFKHDSYTPSLTSLPKFIMKTRMLLCNRIRKLPGKAPTACDCAFILPNDFESDHNLHKHKKAALRSLDRVMTRYHYQRRDTSICGYF